MINLKFLIIPSTLIMMISDGFIVRGPSGPLVVPLGGSVLLPCSVDSLSSLEDLEVEWKRSDSQTLIHLYQDGDMESFNDRAHFFTDDFTVGNFSLLLMNVTAEDEGQYTCTVHSGQESNETVVEIKVERLIVSGSNKSISVYVGDDVTLNCSVDSHIPSEHIEEVSWKKRVKDEHITVLLYESNKIHPDSSDEQYRDRVEFFSDEIHRGNFSLRLKRVRTEDKGLYMCHVFAGRFSDNTTIVLQQLGLSGLHIVVLILCIIACGSALLFCSLIYCRSNNSVFRLQMFLVFCPNIIMFFALVFLGVSEGSVYETVCCCALYVVRPVMLLYTAPYVQQFTGNIKTWILVYSYDTEYIVFSSVLYSVLFHFAWGKSLNYAGFEALIIKVLFGLVLLFYLFYSIYMFGKISGKLSEQVIKILNVLANTFLDVLPSLQLVIMFYSFGSARGGLFIVAVLPVILSATRWNWDVTCGRNVGCSPLVMRSVWFVLMLLVTTVMMFFYIMALENEKDRIGWACIMGFLQVLWTIFHFSLAFEDTDFPRVITVYVFGSVGVVLISAVALMTELILKAGIKPCLESFQKSEEHSTNARSNQTTPTGSV
ncbi:uncharacterized protein LOC130561318 isoform X4 [Triplophysa rosa]|uniref:uncharacterized protein LOC130561318 isoform X4 n=1 Tax=Triplophysa rosa TaxID=992332 RepID=UPI002545BF63|nr:uncharacterized protein LOC130561318 isoform X4 [Triplophysa rosa]